MAKIKKDRIFTSVYRMVLKKMCYKLRFVVLPAPNTVQFVSLFIFGFKDSASVRITGKDLPAD